MRAEIVNQRVEALREVMRREGLAAFIFPSTDPHQSEYVADHWKGREWISGFNGSAGTAVVTLTGAALWTDSRYFLAAEEQLRGTEFQLMKLKMPGPPTIAEWIGSQLSTPSTLHHSPSSEVGVDGTCMSAAEVRTLVAELRQQGGLTLRTNFDPLQQIWTDRPPIPEDKVTIHPLAYAGEATRDKIVRIRKALREQHADGMLMTALDDIAWTLNLRGTDVHCTPVFVSYLLISTTIVTLYVNRKKLTPEVEAYLQHEGVGVDDYANITRGLDDYFEYSILMDPEEVNYLLFKRGERREERGEKIGLRGERHVVEAASPVKALKAVKNATEQAGFRSAMLRDGIALVKFLKWLDEAYWPNGANEPNEPNRPYETELSVDRQLTALRAEQPLYRDLSFDTIAAYGAHGAIVHYEATAESDIPLKAEGLLLLDSGAQYSDGTTDVTRTIALGPVSDEERRAYTLVLKGHLQLQNLKFPDGASGTQLDAVARMAMWREGMNYLHGTGHGVGSCLSVHEGPHQIRMEYRGAPLHAGMTVTDEPGIYVAGCFGVRIENTLLVVPYRTTDFGTFLQFEPLTICPIDKSPIDTSLMTDEELRWLNDYHRMVYERLAPHLDDEEREWLYEACSPLMR